MGALRREEHTADPVNAIRIFYDIAGQLPRIRLRNMRIGTQFMGTVESLGAESIQTKFFILGVPLFPISSHYVVKETFRGINGFDIPLNGKSVGLAYLRTASWLVALLCGVFYYIQDSYERRGSDLLGWTIGAGIVAIVSTFFLGKLSRSEKLRRTMLRLLTGTGAPPELLPVHVRDSIKDKLVEEWHKDRGDQPWDREIENGKGEPLLFALAEYHGRPDLARVAISNIGSQPAPTSPYR
jgi:hypothetical protein